MVYAYYVWKCISISIIFAVEIVQRISASTHYSVELFEIKHAVAISISLVKHLLEFLVRDLLAHLAGDSFEVFKCYFV